MKTNCPISFILAGIGCLSLLVYILACTASFSPDDRQVLYPSFDPKSGAMSIALYDRDTGKSEQIFTGAKPHTDTNIHSTYLRAEWLPDGKHILVTQANGEKALSLFVLPRGVKEPARHISLPDRGDAGPLMYPFAVAGNKVFLNELEKHTLTRVDWVTGEVFVSTNEVVALPGNDGKTILGFREQQGTNRQAEFGVIDPQTLAFTPRLKGSIDSAKATCPLFNPVSGEIYFISGEKTNVQLHVLKDGVEKFTRQITRQKDALEVAGPWLDLGPKQDCLFTAYVSQAEGQTNYEFGLLEIPLNDVPLRFTPLFHLPSYENGVSLAQPSLSHDGRTWAVSSAWLGGKKRDALAPADCALYLVQIDRAGTKVTKVPIPMPAGEDQGLD